MTRTGRIVVRSAGLATALLAATAVLAMMVGTASAAVIYNNIPKPLPGNLPSVPFEASSSSEFGGQVGFASPQARYGKDVIITMSSWACENLQSGANCHTTPKATFNWPITLSIYNVGAGEEPGAQIFTLTQTATIPYRPSANSHLCTPNVEGNVGWGASCFHGKAFKVHFPLGGLKLPDKAIISVAYNTTDYGYEPTHGSPPNIGADSLNVAVVKPPPAVGTNPLPEDGYVNSLWPFMYGGLGTLGTFSLAGPTGYLEGEQPAIEVQAKVRP
jgi:hypothetical protein